MNVDFLPSFTPKWNLDPSLHDQVLDPEWKIEWTRSGMSCHSRDETLVRALLDEFLLKSTLITTDFKRSSSGRRYSLPLCNYSRGKIFPTQINADNLIPSSCSHTHVKIQAGNWTVEKNSPTIGHLTGIEPTPWWNLFLEHPDVVPLLKYENKVE